MRQFQKRNCKKCSQACLPRGRGFTPGSSAKNLAKNTQQEMLKKRIEHAPASPEVENALQALLHGRLVEAGHPRCCAGSIHSHLLPHQCTSFISAGKEMQLAAKMQENAIGCRTHAPDLALRESGLCNMHALRQVQRSSKVSRNCRARCPQMQLHPFTAALCECRCMCAR